MLGRRAWRTGYEAHFNLEAHNLFVISQILVRRGNARLPQLRVGIPPRARHVPEGHLRVRVSPRASGTSERVAHGQGATSLEFRKGGLCNMALEVGPRVSEGVHAPHQGQFMTNHLSR